MATRITLLFWLCLLPGILTAQQADREIWIYVDEYYHGSESSSTLSLTTAHDERFQQTLKPYQHWYRFQMPASENGMYKMHCMGRHKRIWLPETSEPIYISTYGEEVFPHDVQIWTRNSVLSWLPDRDVHVDVETAGVPLLGTFRLLAPFQLLTPADSRELGHVENDLENHLHGHYRLHQQAIVPTLMFLRYEDRYFPLLADPDHHIEVVFETSPTSGEMPTLQRVEGIDDPEGQAFLLGRYPQGLNQGAYERLVQALRDPQRRADTLTTWRRAVLAQLTDTEDTEEDYMDEFWGRLSQLGRWQTAVKAAHFESRDNFHQTIHRKSGRWDSFLMVGFFGSLFALLLVQFLRIRRRDPLLIQWAKRFEGAFHGFAWALIFMGVMFDHHHDNGVGITAPLSGITLFGLAIAFFYFHGWVLVPHFLLRKRIVRYLLGVFVSVVGLVLCYHADINPLSSYRLMYFDHEWYLDRLQHDWQFEQGLFVPIEPVYLLAFMASLVYGTGRHIISRRINQVNHLEKRSQKLDAELSSLKHQLNPHFFFNSLNTVYGFALNEDSPRTAEAVTKLSSLMRFALYEGDQEEVPLEKELEYLADYVELQELRLNPARHAVRFRIEGEAGHLQIAPLLLITLIENAFKHGISMRQSSFVHIDIFIQEHGLIVTVENSVHAREALPVEVEAAREGGIGLTNTRKRLDLLYKGRYEWHTEAQQDRYFTQLSLDL